MFPCFSTSMRAAVLAGVLCCAPLGFAQNDKSSDGQAPITVTMDSLPCNSLAQGSFPAFDFAIKAGASSGTGGAGAGKTVLTDLVIQRPSDSCSLPLFMLASIGVPIKGVVLTQGSRNHGPSLTITLENVQIVSSSLNGSGDETLDLSYSAITITDNAGHTTGRIVRQSGSVPLARSGHSNSRGET